MDQSAPDSEYRTEEPASGPPPDFPVGFLRKTAEHATMVGVAAATAICILGVTDALTDSRFEFAPAYVLVVAFATVPLGRKAGLVVAASATCTAALADATGIDAGDPIWVVANSLVLGITLVLTVQMLGALNRMVNRVERMATTDPLTGAHKEKAWRAVLDTELQRARRSGSPLTLLNLEIANLDRMAADGGLGAATESLRDFVATVRKTVRATDVVGRMPGDMLAVVLPETDHSRALEVVRRIGSATPGSIEVRMGAATFPHPPTTGATAVAAAAATIRDARGGGTTQVICRVFTEPKIGKQPGPPAGPEPPSAIEPDTGDLA